MITIKEAWTNFQKSIFFNLILIAELAICFWLFTMLLNNFVSLGDDATKDEGSVIGDEAYYYCFVTGVRDDTEIEYNNYLGFRSEIRSQELFTFLKEDGGLDTYLPTDFWVGENMEQRLSEAERKAMGRETTALAPIDHTKWEQMDPKSVAGWQLVESRQMDYNAMQHFSLSYAEGSGFAEEDFVFHKGQTTVPIIVGYNSRDIFEVGDTIPIKCCSMPLTGKIVGILERHEYAYIATNELEIGYIPYLDDSIIWPFFDLDYYVSREEAEKSEDAMNEALLQANLCGNSLAGYCVAPKDVSNIEIANIYSTLCQRYNYSEDGFEMHAMTSGMRMFRGETQESIKIMLILVIAMGLFCLFILITNMATKIDRNIRTYMIQILNGASIWNIVAQYLLEIIMIIIPSILITAVIMKREIMTSYQFFIVIFLLSLLCVFISIIIVAMKLANLKTDELLRRKE